MKYDALVVGGGHAGIEAAAAVGRMGLSACLVTLNRAKIGALSCNPAIGGLAKSHVVKELDGLGGIMPRAADITALQYRILNRRKGAAVRATRSQNSRSQYPIVATQLLSHTPGVEIVEAEVLSITIENNRATGVLTSVGLIRAERVIICAGTFLRGLMHTGREKVRGGRRGSAPSEILAEDLMQRGISLSRFKTGTPARIDKNTVDFSQMTEQPGENDYFRFSLFSKKRHLTQSSCWITRTTDETHRIIRENLDRSAMYGGDIDATGARYCPSVEDKIVRFAHHPSHTLILEPEGDDTSEMYLNGFSNSLPGEVQQALLPTIPGLEHARMTQLAYAIEYDVIDPSKLSPTLEHTEITALYFAGQVNGTSGYEEAAGQGIVAGINAAASMLGLPEYRPDPGNSYIGVMIADITGHGVDEPYRLFTARADFRLMLREDNAITRMLTIAERYGLFPDYELDMLRDMENRYIEMQRRAKTENIGPDFGNKTIWDYLREPDADITSISITEDQLLRHRLRIDAKYEGYIEKEQRRLEAIRRTTSIAIPRNIEWSSVPGITAEAVDRLRAKGPKTIGEIQNMRGISKAHILAILSFIRSR